MFPAELCDPEDQTLFTSCRFRCHRFRKEEKSKSVSYTQCTTPICDNDYCRHGGGTANLISGCCESFIPFVDNVCEPCSGKHTFSRAERGTTISPFSTRSGLAPDASVKGHNSVLSNVHLTMTRDYLTIEETLMYYRPIAI